VKLINKSTKKSDGGSLVKTKQVVSQLPFSRYPYPVLCVVSSFVLFAYLCIRPCCEIHMPWSGQEELQRTKARLVREQRQRTLRRQRELLSPSEELYNSDSDSDTKFSHRYNTNKLDHLSKYKRDLGLNVCWVLILIIAANLLVWQFLLLRKA
jgi:hypothetical protein